MLTSEKLRQRWNGLPKTSGGFSRIDSTHPLELYIGWDDLGRRALVLICNREPEAPPSSRAVEVHTGQRQDGQWAVSFRLLRSEQEEVFLQLCTDLIESSRTASDESDWDRVLRRYRHWHKLMERQPASVLSETSRKGLLGELLFMEDLLNQNQHPLEVVKGWMGPEQGDRDFVYFHGWYEVKTVGSAAKTVQISSLQQLDSSHQGELVVYFVDTAAPGDPAAITLNQKVRQVRDQLYSSADAVELFDQKLGFGFGYLALKEYDQPAYRVERVQKYIVTDGFPRLLRRSVPPQIENVKYEISIGALAQWKLEQGASTDDN